MKKEIEIKMKEFVEYVEEAYSNELYNTKVDRGNGFLEHVEDSDERYTLNMVIDDMSDNVADLIRAIVGVEL